MTNEQITTLQDVFEYIQDVIKQSQLIIQDTAEALRKETGCYFKHMRAWDYATRPNEHFLDASLFGISRAWVTYVPEGALSLAALFYIQFFHPKHLVKPALMYGSLAPSVGESCDEMGRWAPYNTIIEVEQKKIASA